jgi:hypothetical protein
MMMQGERATLIVTLVRAGMGAARSGQYADAFIEYRQATEKIDEAGIIVLHPRTGVPNENPFLAVRDRALKKLHTMKDARADVLW